MPETPRAAHPYMPNSTDAAHAALLQEVGAASVDALFGQIPESHRYRGAFGALPREGASEAEIRRRLSETLARNTSCESALSFLGGGVWRHHVPAVCDEIVRRSEFLTPVWGTPSSDFGRNQAWFEYQSQLGELLDMELVALPVYSWGCAVGHAVRMAARLTGRSAVIAPRKMSPERMAVLRTYCEPPESPSAICVLEAETDPSTGRIDVESIKRLLREAPAAVYLETPSFLGMIETDAAEIGRLARAAGAEFIVGVDPVSLGVLAPPSAYGADIAVGSIQPLGVRMNAGGGVGGFIASRDEERYARQYPTLLLSIAETSRPGEYGFGMSLMHQCSYGSREEGNDWTGNSTYLWTIAAAAYMGLMGPAGFADLGRTILRRARFAADLLAGVPGVRVPHAAGFFKEFVVDFSATGRTVAEVNDRLLADGIFGGLDLSKPFTDIGQRALYCVTELHTEADLRRLARSLEGACAQ